MRSHTNDCTTIMNECTDASMCTRMCTRAHAYNRTDAQTHALYFINLDRNRYLILADDLGSLF